MGLLLRWQHVKATTQEPEEPHPRSKQQTRTEGEEHQSNVVSVEPAHVEPKSGIVNRARLDAINEHQQQRPQ